MSAKRILSLVCTIAFFLGAVIPVLALQQFSTMADYTKATGKSIKTFSEAPMLKALVAAKKLPPVAQRVGEVAIVEPFESIGEYGGTMYTVSPTTEYAQEFFLLNGGTGISLMHLQPDCKTIVGNIVKSWSFSPDAKDLTMVLRKIKWSDGQPFTADDIMFWYEDIILNDELTPVKPEMWSPGGKLMKVEKVDQYTVKLRFAVPYPTAVLPLSTLWNINLTTPKHYLKQFHIKYNTKANDVAKEKGFGSWYEYFLDRSKVFLSVNYNPELPVITPYRLTKRTSEYWVMERNPYYWKVDTAGNQLPYLDSIHGTLLTSNEMYNGKIIGGEADFAGASTSIENMALYEANAAKNNYRVLRWKMGYSTILNYTPNLNVKDPVLQSIFRDVRFRRALSLAMNRQEINEVVLFGQGTPVQFTALSASDYYVEANAKAYANYDPAAANKLLDEMGLKWDANHEYRLRPDGKPLQFVVNYVAETAWGMAPAISELVASHWKAVGCKLIHKEVAAPYLSTISETYDYDMGCGWGDAASNALIFWDHHFVTGSWCPAWADWRQSGGKEGEEPIKEVKDNIARWEKMRTTLDAKERIKLGLELMKSQADNVWSIGTVAGIAKPFIARNTLRNLSPSSWYTGDFQDSQPTFPEQWYLQQK